MRLLVFDNYDSFTYNLVHLVEKILHIRVEVMMNDDPDWHRIREFDKVILSPGPGIPSEAGNLLPVIKTFAASKSILGVCLGHQAIAEAFGGRLLNLDEVYHGLSRQVRVLNPEEPIFNGLPPAFQAGRYHSWIVDDKNLPDCLEVTAEDEQGRIMALRHRHFSLQGVQFHPESILTPDGEKIITNWLYA